MNKVIEGEKQFTASVWILSKGSPKKLLLIHHRKSGKWQQPGGHIEAFENPIEAAVREVREETGLDIRFLLKKIKFIDEESSFLPVPDFLMEQTILPHNNESKHYHIDINYVVALDEQEVNHNIRESHDIKWFEKVEIKNLATHGDTKVIVEKIMPE